MTSRRFRDKPFGTMFGSEDPLTVLRTDPDGEARARAMARVAEPAAAGRPDAEQDEVVQILTQAATADPSPWVRMAAVDALGRFQDPRAMEALTAAYQSAPARPPRPTPTVPQTGIMTAGGRTMTEPGLLADRLGLHGPQGFAADQVAAIRGRVLDALGKSGRPEAVGFLTRVAVGQESADDDPASRDIVRHAAVRNLGNVRQPEAVTALARVLADEQGKDLTAVQLAHAGLVGLTGKSLPPDPAAWQELIQAGVTVSPEPNAIQRAVGLDVGR
jgi:HEAT repeat protein